MRKGKVKQHPSPAPTQHCQAAGNETEKQASSTGMCGPSATTRRKARRASQPNAGARHHCLSTRMCELVPARIRREAQGIGAAGAAPTRSAEHTYELQSLMRISSGGFCFEKKTQ